jgi:hypothetical protein
MLHMCVYMHSRLVENHPIQILEDGLISEVVLSQKVSWMPFGPGCTGLRNLCHQGSLRRLLVAHLMAPRKSSGSSLVVFVLCPSLVGYGTQINECCYRYGALNFF